MSLHTFHLAHLPLFMSVGLLLRRPKAPGLLRVEVMAGMELGAAVISPQRMQLRRMAVFAEWENEADVEAFLTTHPVGRKLHEGWHVRLEFLRRWGWSRNLPTCPRSRNAQFQASQ